MKLQSVLSVAFFLTGVSDVSAGLVKSTHSHHHHSHKAHPNTDQSLHSTSKPNNDATAAAAAAGSGGAETASRAASKYHVLKQAITVGKGETFDCQGDTYDRGVKCNNQSETGIVDAVFVVLQGGTLKNCVIGPNQSQGVRCELGSCTFDNITFTDVCEDAITIKGDDEGETSYISNSHFAGAIDKAVQFNGCGKLVVNNCHFTNSMKAIRSCGDCGYNSAKCSRHVKVTNSVFDHVGTVVAINDNFDDTATISGNQFNAVHKVCESYNGVTSRAQRPTDLGQCGANAMLAKNVVMG